MISEMRYTHLVAEAGSLLAELRIQGASYEDLERDKTLLERADPSTIGAIIHDLQTQLCDLQRFNAAEGVDEHYLDSLDYIDLLDEDIIPR